MFAGAADIVNFFHLNMSARLCFPLVFLLLYILCSTSWMMVSLYDITLLW